MLPRQQLRDIDRSKTSAQLTAEHLNLYTYERLHKQLDLLSRILMRLKNEKKLPAKFLLKLCDMQIKAQKECDEYIHGTHAGFFYADERGLADEELQKYKNILYESVLAYNNILLKLVGDNSLYFDINMKMEGPILKTVVAYVNHYYQINKMSCLNETQALLETTSQRVRETQNVIFKLHLASKYGIFSRKQSANELALDGDVTSMQYTCHKK